MDYYPSNPVSGREGHERGQLSVRELGALILDHLGEVAGIAVFIVALTIGYVFLATPIYSADVLVRVEPPEPNALGIAPQQQEVLSLPAPLPSEEMAVMQSRSVLDPIVRRYSFDISVTPRSVPILGQIAKKIATAGQPAEPWFGLSAFAWGGEQVHVTSLVVPRILEERELTLVALKDGEYELLGPSGERMLAGKVGETASADGVSMLVTQLVARPGTQFEVIRWNSLDAITRFMKVLRITDKVKETGLVEITYFDEYAERAAEVANAISQQYISTAVATRQHADNATLSFIASELPRLRAELKRSEEALSDFQASSQSMQPTREAQAYLQGGIEFDRQIATLQIQRTQMLERFTPDSRWVTSIDTQLKQLNAARSAFDARFASMPISERKNADLSRDAKVAETIYLGMVGKAEQLSVRRASTTGGAHIVDNAIRPLRPVKPDPLLVIPGGVAVGLFAGIFIVFIRRHVLMGVRDPLYVERHLSVPVLGEVLFSQRQMTLNREVASRLRRPPSTPAQTHGRTAGLLQHSPTSHPRIESSVQVTEVERGKSKILAERFPYDPSVEELRSVRTALSRNLGRAANNIVMFTGATPEAGKSFIAANLAVLHAEVGARVLLIDADMRRGQLASLFSESNRGGLSEVLRGEIQPSDVIREVGIEGLSFMSCGSHTENPAALLMRYRFKEMLHRLSEQFDLVIVDTPPFLVVTDASIIASEAGSTILVIRSGVQSEVQIADTVKKLQRSEARIAGAVVNAIPLRRSNRDYRYDAYLRSAGELDVTS